MKEKFYRITYNDIGIYQALKNNVTLDVWKELLKDKNVFGWLPKPPTYDKTYYSYFTPEGYILFKAKVLPICEKYLNKSQIKIQKYGELKGRIVYRDKYQIVVDEQYTVDDAFNKIYNKVKGDYV